MITKSVGNCRIEEALDGTFNIIDDIDRVLAVTAFHGIAILLRNIYNTRGSEIELTTGEWQ